MGKLKTIYTCSFCGYQSPKWLGKCPDCDQWNTFYEELQKAASKRTQFEFDAGPRQGPVSLHSINTAQ